MLSLVSQSVSCCEVVEGGTRGLARVEPMRAVSDLIGVALSLRNTYP